SCGGGGAKPGSGDAGRDTPIDTGAGAADGSSNDRPDDGGAGADGAGADAGRQSIGTSCLLATECASGFCVDGVCCDSACTDTCRTCAMQGAVGTCMVADLGTDPRNECDDMGPQSCGTTGVCDGTGACSKYPSGTVCGAQTCTGTMLKAAS